VEVQLVEHQLELVLGEVDVDHRQRDGVEGEVPRRVPGVLPLVRHRDDVVVDHVEPAAVADVAAFATQRMDVMLLQPLVEIEEVVLLAPQHRGQRLTHHRQFRRGGRRRRDRRIELVGLGNAGSEQPVGVVDVFRAGRTQAQANLL
jgi:hypothetical protein